MSVVVQTRTGGNSGGRYAKLTVEESSYSIENNTSTITWTLQVLGGSSNYYNAYEVKVTIGGTVVYGPTSKDWSTQTFPAAKGTKTGSFDVAHNPDGTASSLSVVLRGGFYNDSATNYTGDNLPLTTIPRASTVAFSSSNPTLTTNNAYTITITSASSSFSHKLYYTLGSSGKTLIAEKASGSTTTTHSWTVPRSLANQVTGSTTSSSGAGVITCDTYSGSTLVGSKTCNFTLSVDTGIVPTISSSSISDGNSTVSGKGWGVYLKGKSYLQVAITGSVSSDYGASISRYWCTYEGTTYSDTSVASLNSQLASKALVTGSRSCTLGITDSRGRTASASKSYTVVDYASPSVSSYDAYRTNSGGTASDSGTYFKYFFNCSISSCSNHNPMTVKIRWKKKGASSDTGSSTPKNATTSESSYNSNAVLGSNAITTADTWEIIFEVSDGFSTVSRSKDIGPAFELFHFCANGKSVAFGKKSKAGASSTDSYFEIGPDMRAEIGNGIIKTQKTVSWYQGRANAAAVNEKTSDSGWHPVISSKAKDGDWSIGTYGGDNKLRAVWVADTNYNASQNKCGMLYFPEVAVDASKTLATTSDISNMAKTNVDNGFSTTQTVNGFLQSVNNGVTTKIGAGNSSFSHYYSTSGRHWFDHPVYVAGDVYAGSNYNRRLAYADEAPTYVNGNTITFTKSSGNGNMLYGKWWQFGKVIYLEIAFKTNGGSTSVGSNIWSGTISGPTLPYYRATGVGYYSGSHYIAGLYGQKNYADGSASSSAGRLDIRALGQSVASNSDAHSLSITYIIP